MISALKWVSITSRCRGGSDIMRAERIKNTEKVSITSRCRGGSDAMIMIYIRRIVMMVSITSRCRGGSDKYWRYNVMERLRVSITSRCRGGSDCKPTSLHGYAANRDLDFKKTSILLHFCHPFDYILAQFF